MLTYAGIATTVITDAAIFAVMARINKVIVGCQVMTSLSLSPSVSLSLAVMVRINKVIVGCQVIVPACNCGGAR
jgi:translation initiation factor 2B subunit (eIF-2B alpha/beta/delta family)